MRHNTQSTPSLVALCLCPSLPFVRWSSRPPVASFASSIRSSKSSKMRAAWMFLAFVSLILLVTGSQSLMFKPTPGDACSDNIDCMSGCCLMTGHRHRRPTGVCQSLRQMEEYCAPGNRLRNYYGSRVYTYSCPCGAGLVCKPRWSSSLYGRSVMEDPKCMPESMPPYVLALRGHGYNVYHRHSNVINVVPAE